MHFCIFPINPSVTGDGDVDGVARLPSGLTPVLSAVRRISRLDGAGERCRRHPGADTLAHDSPPPPHDRPAGRDARALAVKRDGAVLKELQFARNDARRRCRRADTERRQIK